MLIPLSPFQRNATFRLARPPRRAELGTIRQPDRWGNPEDAPRCFFLCFLHRDMWQLEALLIFLLFFFPPPLPRVLPLEFVLYSPTYTPFGTCMKSLPRWDESVTGI